MIKTKFLHAFTIVLILLQAIMPIPALAMAGSDLADYLSGSVVTISGDNSTGAGYLPLETVHVDVSGPNDTLLSCEATADESGAWSCQVTLPSDESAAGYYEFTAVGQTSGVSKSGAFTVTAPPPPAVDPTPEPTQEPTAEPTQEPMTEPTAQPTSEPTAEPTAEPTQEPAPASFIQSDKEDYLAGELVTLTSGNWLPGEMVHLFVNDDQWQTWYMSIDVQADDNGSFTHQFNLPNWFVAVYRVTATGTMSGTAVTTFTDSRTINSVMLNSGTSVTVPAGATISASVNVTTTTSGGNNDWQSTSWRIATTPSGGTSTCMNHTDHNDSGTYTETFNITAPTSPGTYNAYFIAYSNNGCTNQPSLTYIMSGAVVVTAATTLTLAPPSPSSITYGSTGPVSLSATLTSGSAVSGATIDFLVDNSSVGSAVTNVSGVATLSYDPSALNAGSHNITASFAGQTLGGITYTGTSSGTQTLNVGQASSTTTVTCPASVVYDGAAQEPCTVSVTGAGGLNLSPDAVYTDNTDAGTASASYTYSGDANHTGSSDAQTFEIEKAVSVTDVSCPASVTYDSTAQTPCTVTVTGAGGLNLSPAAVYVDNTAAGTATASYLYPGDTNHESSSDSATFEIDPAATVTTVSCPGSVVYDGTPQEPCTAEVTGAGGLSRALTVSYLDNVNAGTATASASYSGNANHTGSNDSQDFEIEKAGSVTDVSCSANVVYNGAAQEPCTVSVTGAGGLNFLPAADYTDNTDAGTATASYTFAGDANHTGSSDSQSFEIEKAPTTTTVTCPESMVYSGAALTPCSAVVTGAGGLEDNLTVLYIDNTNAGTSTASASYPGSANYLASDDSVTFSIDQASSETVVSCPVSVTYDGSAQEPCTAVVTGAGGLNQALTVLYADNTNAGTSTASASYSGDANHTGSSDSKTFEIDPAASETVVSCPESVVYDGSVQEPCTAEVTGAGGLSQSLPVSYEDNVNAGTATASASYPGDENHEASDDSVEFQIEKAATVTTVSCPESVTYTGDPQAPCTAVVTGAGGLNQALTVSYSDNTDAGTATANASYPGDANHFGSSDSQTFEIEKAASLTTVTCPESVTYNGDPQTPCTAVVTGAGGLNLTLPVSYADNVNAGTATASAAYDGDANHEASSDSQTFEIEKAESVTTVTCPGNVTYTGAALEPCSAVVTGAGGLSESLTVSYSDNTNAGTATASASYAGDGNHEASSDSAEFEIEKAGSLTVVSCPTNVTYTGAAHEPCTAVVTGAGGLNQALTVSYSDNTDAGTAAASSSYAGDANHLSSSDSATFTIDKAVSVTAVSCPANVSYTGAALEPCSVSVTGAGGLNLTPEAVYENNINAGTATASYSYPGDDNHLGSEDSAIFTIDKAVSVTVVTCLANVTYTGAALEACSANVSGAGGLEEILTVLYANNTEAGSASASASYPGDDNHLGSNDSTTFTIDKAASTTVVTCLASVTYTGDPQMPCTAQVTGAGELDQSLTVLYANNTNAGTAAASASYAGDANHLDSEDSKTFTINKAASTTIVTCPENLTYDGDPHEPCSAQVTGAGGLIQTLTISYSNNTDAGMATASASFAGDANHEASSDSETFEIEKADSVTVVSCPASVTYTGAALEPCTVSVTGAGGLNLTPGAVYSDNTAAGTATASYSYPGDDNHFGSNDLHTFTIDKAGSTTVVTCTANVTYTGAALEPCTAVVTGAGGLNQSLPVIYSDNTNAGTATASASFAGDANHTGSSDSQTFTIDKAASVTTVTCPASVTYSGLPQTPCTASVSGAGGLSQALTVSYSSNTQAGTVTASANYPGDANHEASSDSQTFTIAKAILNVTADNKSKYFAGPDPAFTFQYSGFVNGETASVIDTPPTCAAEEPHAAVGEYHIVCSGGVDNNYSFNYVPGTLNVAAWTLRGFYSPVDMSGSLTVYNLVKGGSTVPLKFEIFSGSTELTNVADVMSLTYALNSCNSSAVTDEIETVATGGTVLRYDATAGQFVYNWQTPKTPGKCYRVTMTTQDGTTLQAFFKLK